jgi:opacity protein-like surface antigen
MKKRTFINIILLLFIFIHKTEAQTSKVILSIEASPNVRFLSGNSNSTQLNKPAIGFYSGITAQFPLKNDWSIVTGIGFERKGGVIKTEWTDFNANPIGIYNTYVNHDYLVIPVLFRLSFGDKINYYINGGLYYGYLLAAKFNAERPNLPNVQLNDENIRKSDFGLSIGGGIKINIAKNLAIPIEIRSNHGLINTNKAEIINNGAIKPNAVNLIVGLSYNFSS